LIDVAIPVVWRLIAVLWAVSRILVVAWRLLVAWALLSTKSGPLGVGLPEPQPSYWFDRLVTGEYDLGSGGCLPTDVEAGGRGASCCAALGNSSYSVLEYSDWVVQIAKEIHQVEGVSCVGFELQFMEILTAIETSCTQKVSASGSKPRKKGSRELRRLECSINYDSKGESSYPPRKGGYQFLIKLKLLSWNMGGLNKGINV